MSTADRTTACLPIDVVRLVDATTTQEQITGGTYLGGDDRETLRSFIEDAENEFKQRTGESYRIGRQGLSGARETYEEVTYKLSGHKQYRRTFSHGTFDYSFREGTVTLGEDRVLPFDTDEGDEIYIYAGLNSDERWVDLTGEEGETWDIVNHREGRLAIDPNQLRRNHSWFAGDGLNLSATRQRNVRLAITYRYGSLGGSRQGATTTTLTQQIDDTETGTVSVADGSLVPSGGSSGPVTFRLGEEYVLADPDPAGDAISILERGVRGTSATEHDDGARLNYTPPAIRKAIAARAGMGVLSSGRYQAWAPDTDESFQLDDVRGQLEETYMNTVEAMS